MLAVSEIDDENLAGDFDLFRGHARAAAEVSLSFDRVG
jgi:hypothetical protein